MRRIRLRKPLTISLRWLRKVCEMVAVYTATTRSQKHWTASNEGLTEESVDKSVSSRKVDRRVVLVGFQIKQRVIVYGKRNIVAGAGIGEDAVGVDRKI